MPYLPYLKYSKDFRHSYITDFGGIRAGAISNEGGIYDALNMSDYNAPAISTRLGFAGVFMEDENGDEVLIDEDILCMDGDNAGGGFVLVGSTKLWYYSFEDGFWRVFALGAELNEKQRIIGWKRQYDAGIYKHTFHVYFILPSAIAFVKADLKTKSGSTVSGFPKYYIESIGSFSESITNTTTQGKYLNGLYYNETTSKTPPKYGGKSVITSLSSLPFIPGIYIKINKKLEGTEKETEQTGLILHKIYAESSQVYYSPFAYNSVVLSTDAGFPFSSMNPEYVSEVSIGSSAPKGDYEIGVDIPDKVRGAFIHANRLWAWDETNIYASALGVYELFSPDGTDAGGWSAPIVSGEKVTAGISYGGRPVFFTANSIITVYGDYPSTFSFSAVSAPGVSEAARESLSECAGCLYYLSHAGVMRYNGNMPVCISDELSDFAYTGGVSASDAKYYYLYARYLKGAQNEQGAKLYSYNTKTGTWHVMDYTGSLSLLTSGNKAIVSPVMARVSDGSGAFSHVVLFNNNKESRGLYCVPSKNREPLLFNAAVQSSYFGYNDSYYWRVRFGRFFCVSPNIKGLLQIQLRARLLSPPILGESGKYETGFKVKICYDDADAAVAGRDISDDTGFETVHTEAVEMDEESRPLSGEQYRVRNIFIPVQPRRFDNFKIELSGTGRWEISSLSFTYAVGSERVKGGF